MHSLYFMVYICGINVHSMVQNLRTNQHIYTHIHHSKFVQSFLAVLSPFYTNLSHHVFHPYFHQITPVKGMLYTQSTLPTITTT